MTKTTKTVKRKPKNWAKKLGDPLWKTRRTFTARQLSNSFAVIEAARLGRTEKDIVAGVPVDYFRDDAREQLGAAADRGQLEALALELAFAQAEEIARALNALEHKHARDSAINAGTYIPAAKRKAERS